MIVNEISLIIQNIKLKEEKHQIILLEYSSSIRTSSLHSRRVYGCPKENKICSQDQMMKIAKDRKVIPDPIDDRKFQE
tara:strand:- start:217 stop:450 length:234 start_codon:yes stop_codon:yes gene_type:complete